MSDADLCGCAACGRERREAEKLADAWRFLCYRDLASRWRALAVLEGRVSWYRVEVARLEAEIQGLEAQRVDTKGPTGG